MCIDTKDARRELSHAATDASKVYRKAKKFSPAVKKEVTVKTQYFARENAKHPCAETFFKLGIDCNLVKAIIMLFAVMCVISCFCMMFRRKKRK